MWEGLRKGGKVAVIYDSLICKPSGEGASWKILSDLDGRKEFPSEGKNRIEATVVAVGEREHTQVGLHQRERKMLVSRRIVSENKNTHTSTN
jgi:hypothetical protein